MHSRIMLLAILLVVSMPCGAGEPSEAVLSKSPDGGDTFVDDGFSAQGIQAIEDLMQQAVTDRRIPAAVAMLAHDSEIVWLGTAAMILYERGVIALDDPAPFFFFLFYFGKLKATTYSPAVVSSPPAVTIEPLRPPACFSSWIGSAG